MVARTDMDVFRLQRDLKLTGYCLGFRDLLRCQPLTLQHVLEVCIATEVELVGMIEPDTPTAEQIGQHPMDNRRSDLTLDIVANERQPGPLKSAPPYRIGSDEHGDTV